MLIAITQDYQNALIPFDRNALASLNIPKETADFLTEVGLPIHSEYELTPNVPLKFYTQLAIKRYPYLRLDYLPIASLGDMGELAIGLTHQAVQQIQITTDCGYELATNRLVNNSLSQFVQCLGLYLSFYPQLCETISQARQQDPTFDPFDHEKLLYRPILEALKAVDAKALREKKFFWRRLCEPDMF